MDGPLWLFWTCVPAGWDASGANSPVGVILLGSFFWGAPQWLPALGAILAAALLLLAWSYGRTLLAARWFLLAFFLKLAAVVFLALAVADPLWSGTRPKPGANSLLLVMDESQSMNLADGPDGTTRADQAKSLFAEQAPWLQSLARDFSLRHFACADKTHEVATFAELDFQGRQSRLATTLRALSARFRGRPVAGIFLCTDGNNTDAAQDRHGMITASSARSAPGADLWGLSEAEIALLPPLFPVVLGGHVELPDLAIARVSVSQTAFEDAPVTIQAGLLATGLEGQTVLAKLVDEQGQVAQKLTLAVTRAHQELACRFPLRPPAGLTRWRLESEVVGTPDAAKEKNHSKKDPVSSNPKTVKSITEATLCNNSRLLSIQRGAEPYRILYVSGRPNWEYKFLQRALLEDEQLQLVGLIRVARREPKFDWRGRAGESSNPLFRGFKGTDAEQTERFDQPVFVRLNTSHEAELRDGFPKKRADLFAYHAVIIDDLEAEFFTHEQQLLLQRFVRERGGSVLMLGGQESFHAGGYAKTPLGDLLPVYLDGTPAAESKEWRFKLTREGWLAPWVRLHGTEAQERQRLEEMPTSRIVHPQRQVKPGASVLAEVQNQAGATMPALITQRFGRGRSAALTIGDLWRWRMRRPVTDRLPEKAWRQTVRWLVADVPARFEPSIEPDSTLDGGIRLVLRARSPDFEPLEDAQVQFRIVQPDGSSISLDAEPRRQSHESEATDLGTFEADFLPHHDGVYRIEAKITQPDAKETHTVAMDWIEERAATEFARIPPQRARLAELARRTGGELLEPSQLASFAERFSRRAVPIVETRTVPVWHQPWWFLAALGCLIGEWTLRRGKGWA